MELSLNGQAFKKSVGNPRSAGSRWKYQQEKTTSAQPKFVFGALFPSLEKEEMQSDREVTGETNATAGSPDSFSCPNEGPCFFFASVPFIQSKCSHYPVHVKGSWPLPELDNKGVSQEQSNL